ncbi:GGDEF domain-containing protein, partial [Cyanobium sp. A1C-AMD]|uniref:GGDEF domain-containing protein n=1 Tax=Cyanobium sp. A1C-AMD TaxID=2823694 RepID=UPI0020CC4857
YGHPAGDHVLVEFCQRIQVKLRDSDAFGRWGGEEFLIVLPHCDIAAGKSLAEKLRSCIACQPFSEVGMVTASFGVAQRQRREDQLVWIQRADQHLYIAKNGGRNRVVTADR